MSNEGQRSASFPYRPFHVYANIGDENSLISVKRFARELKPEPGCLNKRKKGQGTTRLSTSRSLTVRHSHTAA